MSADEPLYIRKLFPPREEDTRPLYLRKLRPRPEEDTRPLFLQKRYPRPVEPRPNLTHGQPVPPRLLRARLAGLLRTVHTAPHGKRNDTLHWAACRVGEMIAAGEVTDVGQATDALTTVALATGLESSEVRGTIRSGFMKYGVGL